MTLWTWEIWGILSSLTEMDRLYARRLNLSNTARTRMPGADECNVLHSQTFILHVREMKGCDACHGP